MKLNIAVLPGDGIGPEIMVQGVAVMKAVEQGTISEERINQSVRRILRLKLAMP